MQLMKRKKSPHPIPHRKRNLNKRKRGRKAGTNKMSKKEEREFFGHKFGPLGISKISRKWEIHIPEGNSVRTAECTLIGDKNHNLMAIECDDNSVEAEEINNNMLSMWRGHNILTFGEEGDYYD